MRRLIVMALAAMICYPAGQCGPSAKTGRYAPRNDHRQKQASIEEAKVKVENEATGVSATTSASSAGTYVFPNLLVEPTR